MHQSATWVWWFEAWQSWRRLFEKARAGYAFSDSLGLKLGLHV